MLSSDKRLDQNLDNSMEEMRQFIDKRMGYTEMLIKNCVIKPLDKILENVFEMHQSHANLEERIQTLENDMRDIKHILASSH